MMNSTSHVLNMVDVESEYRESVIYHSNEAEALKRLQEVHCYDIMEHRLDLVLILNSVVQIFKNS